ncbi:MAG: hypothetical protein EOM80_16065 [Erysipelotrichia bacterium]|nr:hypothetical protein [Erysipelotrichia bacterium]
MRKKLFVLFLAVFLFNTVFLLAGDWSYQGPNDQGGSNYIRTTDDGRYEGKQTDGFGNIIAIFGGVTFLGVLAKLKGG